MAKTKKIITINLPEIFVDFMDFLIDNGYYNTRSEIARLALREQIKADRTLEIEMKNRLERGFTGEDTWI